MPGATEPGDGAPDCRQPFPYRIYYGRVARQPSRTAHSGALQARHAGRRQVAAIRRLPKSRAARPVYNAGIPSSRRLSVMTLGPVVRRRFGPPLGLAFAATLYTLAQSTSTP